MNRREFLTELSSPLSNSSAPPEQLVPALALPCVPTAGSPRQYRTGTQVLVTDVQVWLCRDDGGFYAIDAHCPHLGCLVRPAEDGFICPGHHSRFNAQGECEAGCAARGLRYLYLDVDAAGHLTIDRDRRVDPRDRLMT